jgi:hypothetical protein
MTQKDSYDQVLESLVAEATHGVVSGRIDSNTAQPVRAVRTPGRLLGGSAPEEIDLVLLAHDHVLEQVL